MTYSRPLLPEWITTRWRHAGAPVKSVLKSASEFSPLRDVREPAPWHSSTDERCASDLVPQLATAMASVDGQLKYAQNATVRADEPEGSPVTAAEVRYAPPLMLRARGKPKRSAAYEIELPAASTTGLSDSPSEPQSLRVWSSNARCTSGAGTGMGETLGETDTLADTEGETLVDAMTEGETEGVGVTDGLGTQ